MTINDPALQRSTMDLVMGQWIERHRDGAKKWLSTPNSFPADWVKKWQVEAASK